MTVHTSRGVGVREVVAVPHAETAYLRSIAMISHTGAAACEMVAVGHVRCPHA